MKERIAHGGLVVLIPLMEAHIALLQDLSHFAATNEQSHKERLLNAFNAVGCPNRNVDQVKIDAWKQMDDDNLKANMLSICQSSGQSSGQRALCCGDVDGCPRSCMELRHAPATMKDILMDKQRQALLTQRIRTSFRGCVTSAARCSISCRAAGTSNQVPRSRLCTRHSF